MMKTKRAVIVQCRLSSQRLPQKAVKELGGKPVLAWVLSSMKKVSADKYYVATDEESFPVLEPICKQYGFDCFAGDLNNVLKRFCDLIKKLKVQTIIRATADNPFLFYEAAEASVKDFEEKNSGKLKCDYLTYSGLPHGSGVEIFSAESLLKAQENTDDPYDKEHVGPALYNHTDKFNCQFIKAPSRYNHPELRTTIDTYSDYLRAVNVVEYLSQKNVEAPYTTEQIIEAEKSSFVKNPVVFIPSVVKGHGTGHLHRCLEAAIEADAFVYIPKDFTLAETSSIVELYKENGLKKQQIISSLPDETYKAVYVTDLMVTSKDEAEKFRLESCQYYAIDEGGNTSSADYQLDIIPSVEADRTPNLFDADFIKMPENRRAGGKGEFKKVLICVGGEDPAGITDELSKKFQNLLPGAEISTGPVKNLREKLYEYDLVVTHYGLTAFEAAYAGCAVIMPSTTPLHEELAKKYKFAFIPYKQNTEENIKSALASDSIYSKMFDGYEKKSLGKYIRQLSTGSRLCCPVCQKQSESPDEIISRNQTRTYRRCSECGLVYMSWTTVAEKSYEKAYFFEDYKKQYGKTYQEDFESIKKSCLLRVDNIKKVQKTSGNNVLDIGCAYGPFLSAAFDKGFSPYGTDISNDAVDYVKRQLHFPASSAAFPCIDPVKEYGISQFDVVTMWYVIEHFKNLDEVLKKVSSLTKKNGIFAFSTPSGEGISATSNKDNFYQISPMDHYSIWEPRKADKILNKYGFEIVKIVSTGHHPERFPSIKECGAKPGSMKWKLTDKLSRLKNLGDTVEIYCRKVK